MCYIMSHVASVNSQKVCNPTALLLTSSVTQIEIRVLNTNLFSLVSQQETVQSILHVYASQYHLKID
jgi:hypothetical protein